MKYALVKGDKVEATHSGARGQCRVCGSEMIAHCGEDRVNHWKHKSKKKCDQWWENETEWHRDWKNKFPENWQEEVLKNDQGETHVADVKTESGYVIEFQHSFLSPEKRRARNAFYQKLIWVIDGKRRPTDIPQFDKKLRESGTIKKEPLIVRVYFPDECRLLREWHNSQSLVFFDFQGLEEKKQLPLWFLFPMLTFGEAYLLPFSRQKFIEMHNKNEFDQILDNVIWPIHEILAVNLQNRKKQRNAENVRVLSGFGRHLYRQKRKKRL